MKSIPAPTERWTHRKFEVQPILDENGNPLTEPPLNKEGFWKKPQNSIVTLLNRTDNGKRATTHLRRK